MPGKGALSHFRLKVAGLRAWQALVSLLVKDQACREFVTWTGYDMDGVQYTSGFYVALRLRRSKSHELQRAGAHLLHTVLLHNDLKHSERITVAYVQGLCDYCHASDQEAACRAAKIILAIFNKVHDTGIRWTVSFCVCYEACISYFSSFAACFMHVMRGH